MIMPSFLRVILLNLLLTAAVAETPVTFEGTIQKHIPQSKRSWIQLLRINFSPRAHQKILNHLEQLEIASNQDNTAHKHINLGMNNVPTLNQGSHGSCVTFALTAAIDALIGQGDYVSQLCLLTLGQYLHQHSFAYSGWEGISPKDQATRILEHGIINKTTQITKGCGGLNQYPLISIDPDNEMSLQDYKEKTEDINELTTFDTSSLLDIYQFLLEESPRKNILAEVKSSLEQGDRLAIASIIIADENLSLWGKYHQDNDSWVYLPELKNAFESLEDISSHELIIIGYDDDASIIDKYGESHQGILILRNSWGPNAGDHGDFYMSYDYFNAFVFDVLRIRNLDL